MDRPGIFTQQKYGEKGKFSFPFFLGREKVMYLKERMLNVSNRSSGFNRDEGIMPINSNFQKTRKWAGKGRLEISIFDKE